MLLTCSIMCSDVHDWALTASHAVLHAVKGCLELQEKKRQKILQTYSGHPLLKSQVS